MTKRIFLYLFVALSAFVQPSSAQISDQVLSQLKSSILAADAAGLAEQTMYSVEIAIFGEGRFYSQGQATLLLKSFFKEYPPDTFEIVGSRRTPGAWFIEGEYGSESSETMIRMYIRLRINAGTWKVREILIENTDA